MKKALIVSLVAGAALLAAPVFAQTYTVSCFTPTQGISVGSRGSGVSALQQFLVAQNYPGSGSWMVTGYFGSATAAALRNFQFSQGLPQTGTIDAATAAAISRVSCGAAAYTAYPGYGTYPGYTGGQYPGTYYPSYYYGNAPTITSLSQNTGAPGASVTIYGVGFDPYSNTVNFDGTSLAGIPSPSGTSLTFTIPSTAYGYSYSYAGTQVQLSVSTSRGTSNSMTFTLYSYSPYFNYGYPYNQYGCGSYNPYNTYGYFGYNSCVPPQTATPVIQYLNPTSGSVGTSVTIYGTGFSYSGNSVRFGPGVIAGLQSPDGRSLSFTVPSQLTGYGSQPITLSTYQVSVVNASGAVSNAMPFTVTSTGNSGGQPVISSVSGPNTLGVGQQGSWSFVVTASSGQYLTVAVSWGDQNYYGTAPAAQQQYYANQQVTLTHTYYQPGTYPIQFTITNQFGQSNIYRTNVTVGGGTYSNVSLSSLSPQSARVGQQIMLSGSGFTQDNTIHFGVGGIQHVSSYGNTLYFTVPSSVSPCDVQQPGTYCAQYLQQVTPGTYPVYVTNSNGTSNTLNFTVTY